MLSKPTIIVCTDFGPGSDVAIKSAENIRKKVGGDIHAVHISNFPIQWDWMAQESTIMYQYEKFNAGLLQSLNKQMKDQLARCEIQCKTDVSLGSIYEGIIEKIEVIKPDFVVMGYNQHPPGFFNLGSVVSKVVASSKVPVLVIKKMIDSNIRRIAGLVDASSLMKPIISATEEFSFVLSAAPEVISLWKNSASQFYKNAPVNQETKAAILKNMADEINQNIDEHSKCKVRVEITDERKVAYHLVKVLENEHIDMAVMKRHQRNLLEKMFIGSETRRMLELFKGNILVLPP